MLGKEDFLDEDKGENEWRYLARETVRNLEATVEQAQSALVRSRRMLAELEAKKAD